MSVKKIDHDLWHKQHDTKMTNVLQTTSTERWVDPYQHLNRQDSVFRVCTKSFKQTETEQGSV